MVGGLSSSGAHGTLLQVVDPAEETFPYSGRIEFVEPEGGEVITAGRAEAWAKVTPRASRSTAPPSARKSSKLGWLFSTHTTDRSAAELLLYLHSGMMVAKGSAGRVAVNAGRTA